MLVVLKSRSHGEWIVDNLSRWNLSQTLAWNSNLAMIQLISFWEWPLWRKIKLSLNLGLIQGWTFKRSFFTLFQRHSFEFHGDRICFLERPILNTFLFLYLIRYLLNSCIIGMYLMKGWGKHILFELWLLFKPESVDLLVASFLLIFFLIVFVSGRMMEKGLRILITSTIAFKACPVFRITFHQE